eukprot:4094888-Prymnesium_polylepis.2
MRPAARGGGTTTTVSCRPRATLASTPGTMRRSGSNSGGSVAPHSPTGRPPRSSSCPRLSCTRQKHQAEATASCTGRAVTRAPMLKHITAGT